MSEAEEQTVRFTTRDDLHNWMVGLVRICGDEIPTAKQWARFAELVEEVQANEVRKRIMDQDHERRKMEEAMKYQQLLLGMKGANGPAQAIGAAGLAGYVSSHTAAAAAIPYNGVIEMDEPNQATKASFIGKIFK
jgi:hypothetical protein